MSDFVLLMLLFGAGGISVLVASILFVFFCTDVLDEVNGKDNE